VTSALDDSGTVAVAAVTTAVEVFWLGKPVGGGMVLLKSEVEALVEVEAEASMTAVVAMVAVGAVTASVPSVLGFLSGLVRGEVVTDIAR
jgi:hypothetical protein